MIVDSHAHLDVIDDLEDSLKRAKEAGVGKIITIGASIESSRKAVEIAEDYSGHNLKIYATCGFHPKDSKSDFKKFTLLHCFETLKQILQSSRHAVGVGEIGLDYYLESSGQRPVTSNQEREFQKKLFAKHIDFAVDLNLPLVIHCRNAWEDIFSLMSTDHGLRTKLRGVFHSWTGNWGAAKKALDLGFYISFSGIVTFGNAKDVQEVAKKVPLERILIETDSPFLAPEPLRTKPNEPKNVRIIAEFIAKLRNVPLDTITGATANNAGQLFEI